MGWLKDLFKGPEQQEEEYIEVVDATPPPPPPPKPAPQPFRCNGCGRKAMDSGSAACSACNKKFCPVCLEPKRHTCRGKRSY
ncbi:hypothetical protein HZB03_01095 [Candidatus Woesearchaeota archaeon]|nr:hypothetical protein [Candidatus Woesearchaeota archaeon]